MPVYVDTAPLQRALENVIREARAILADVESAEANDTDRVRPPQANTVPLGAAPVSRAVMTDEGRPTGASSTAPRSAATDPKVPKDT